MTKTILSGAIESSVLSAMVEPAVKDLIDQIKGDDEEIRSKAWQHAFTAGPGAIKPLAALTTGTTLEIGRAAKRAIWKIVRYAGRPDADVVRVQVVGELLDLLGGNGSRAVQAEVIWMLSEIGGDECVDQLSALLSNQELREDARMALQRIAGDKSLGALKSALDTVPDDFRINIVQSLRKRGINVAGWPCRKLVPTKQTKVKPVGR